MLSERPSKNPSGAVSDESYEGNSPLRCTVPFLEGGALYLSSRAHSFERALALANDSDYAITGGVFSRNPANIDRAKVEFRVGDLYINRAITGALVCRQQFGGFKVSGIGSKAGDRDYLLQFMEPRCITENTMRRGFTPDPNT